MTAEIAIMNKSAVALATDSAVTIRHPQGSKIYKTANKLFRMSLTDPVGIMIYNNPELMGVPLETVIKLYRIEIQNQSFTTLEEYATRFFDFLEEKCDWFFPVEAQYENFSATIDSYYIEIRGDIDNAVKEEFKVKRSLSKNEVRLIIKKLLKNT